MLYDTFFGHPAETCQSRDRRTPYFFSYFFSIVTITQPEGFGSAEQTGFRLLPQPPPLRKMVSQEKRKRTPTATPIPPPPENPCYNSKIRKGNLPTRTVSPQAIAWGGRKKFRRRVFLTIERSHSSSAFRGWTRVTVFSIAKVLPSCVASPVEHCNIRMRMLYTDFLSVQPEPTPTANGSSCLSC